MQRSQTYSPTSLRPPSMDSLCMLDDENFSPTELHEVSSSPSNAATIGVLNQDSAPDLVALPLASDSTTTLGSTGPPLPAHESTPRFLRKDFFKEKWLWETTCILFSTACVITMTILSSRLDGMWLSNWTLFLQPSTIFSVLSASAQSSMMVVVVQVLSQLKWLQMRLPKAQPVADFVTFGSASRGPLGSLSLFYLWNPESWVLAPIAYTASLVTIAALAMGPFTQQVISIRSDNLVPIDGTSSTIAVSNCYNSFEPTATGLNFAITENGTIAIDSDDFFESQDLTKSFYNGWSYLSKSPIEFSCSSNNCTWDTFSSLGICSTCQDVTETAQISGNHGRDTTITTPGGWFIETADMESERDDVQSQPLVKANSSFQNDISTLENLTANVVSMVVVQMASDNPRQRFTITECSVDWCAKQYSNIAVTNGTLQEHNAVQEVPLSTVAGQDFGGLSRGKETNNWDFLLTTDADGENVSSPLPPFEHSEFRFSIYDHLSIMMLFDMFLDTGPDEFNNYVNYSQNIILVLSNLADSLTGTIMRSNGKSMAPGIAWRQEPSIEVQWGWLAFPWVLVVSSAILLVLMIMASRHYDAPHWNTSLLPFLFHGIQNWDDDEELDLIEGRLEKVYVMEERAKSKRVRLVASLEGGRWLAE